MDSTQKKIKSETLNLSGIYLILNKITLDYYIGSASTNRFFARFSNHLVNFHGSKIVTHPMMWQVCLFRGKEIIKSLNLLLLY